MVLNNRTIALIIALGAILLGSIWYVVFGGTAIAKNESGVLLPQNADVVTLGRQLYAENCASCHGVNLEGQTPDWRSPGPDGKLPAPPHDETGHTWHHPDALLFEITKFGVAAAANLKNYESAMPIYEGVLSDDEIIAVLSFIKSTWPEDLQARHNQLNAQYEQRDQ